MIKCRASRREKSRPTRTLKRGLLLKSIYFTVIDLSSLKTKKYVIGHVTIRSAYFVYSTLEPNRKWTRCSVADISIWGCRASDAVRTDASTQTRWAIIKPWQIADALRTSNFSTPAWFQRLSIRQYRLASVGIQWRSASSVDAVITSCGQCQLPHLRNALLMQAAGVLNMTDLRNVADWSLVFV